MSKAAEKADTRWARYRSSQTMLGRMIGAYREATELDGRPIDSRLIADEIVSTFRSHGCCLDHSGVSYDGPMAELIAEAMKAAEEHGVRR